MTTLSPSASSICSCINPKIQITFDIVNWDALSSLVCKLHQVDSSHWGEQISGGYNLVRFLHLHNSKNTTLVARVPLRSEDDLSGENDSALSKQIESEVATMEYVERYTNIPVPHVYHCSSHTEGDVHSPYILMSKVEGVQLSSVWDDMDEDKRRIILQQVIDILLELWPHRFEKDGVLFKRADGRDGKDAWYVELSSIIESPGDINFESTISHSNAVDCWLACVNAKLYDICNQNFGSNGKHFSHSSMWFVHSHIPSLFNSSIDNHGFSLCPGDFHSQNIMITDVDTHPRIGGGVVRPNLRNNFCAVPLHRRSPRLRREPPTAKTECTRSGHF